MSGRYPDQETLEKIKQLHEQGLSGYKIAKKLGISQQRVYYWLNKFKKEMEVGKDADKKEEVGGSVIEREEVFSNTSTEKEEKQKEEKEKEKVKEDFEELEDDVKEEEQKEEKEEVKEWRKLILRI